MDVNDAVNHDAANPPSHDTRLDVGEIYLQRVRSARDNPQGKSEFALWDEIVSDLLRFAGDIISDQGRHLMWVTLSKSQKIEQSRGKFFDFERFKALK